MARRPSGKGFAAVYQGVVRKDRISKNRRVWDVLGSGICLWVVLRVEPISGNPVMVGHVRRLVVFGCR